jgi:ribosomal protein S18 acetylase RimI-like enzyme
MLRNLRLLPESLMDAHEPGLLPWRLWRRCRREVDDKEFGKIVAGAGSAGCVLGLPGGAVLGDHRMTAEEQAGTVEIELLARDAGDDAVAEVTNVVNRVYAIAEEGLWRDGTARTTPPEITDFIRGGEIAVARLDGRIVGSVRIQRLDGGVGEFGMLAADPGHRGVGIGRRLVRFAERLIHERGFDTMQLELLVPRAWTHPAKKFLHDWYTRLGYRVIRTGSIDEQYPALAPRLATPCDFVIYHKKLG